MIGFSPCLPVQRLTQPVGGPALTWFYFASEHPLLARVVSLRCNHSSAIGAERTLASSPPCCIY